jgi:cytochrome b6-f complex iron-sulfur subunit
MAKRLSVKEMLEAARKAGGANAGEAEPTAPAAEEAAAEPQAAAPDVTARPAVPAPAAAPAPTPQTLGRPLTLKEKLAAARSGAAPVPSASAASPIAPEVEVEGEPAAAPPAKAVPPPPAPLGRPMTLAEKLAAARGTAPAAGGAAAPPKPALAKPTAAKPAAAKRELPPLDKITDPKDLAEALRQAGEKKVKEVEAAKIKAAPPSKPAKEKESKPTTVLPKPSKGAALASAAMPRRAFLSIMAIIWIGWGFFTLGVVQFTAMLGRFMFPNVLAEPPSTIKIGLPTNYEPETVNERFKAEWGFWVVRSTRFNGEDIIYAIQSVCTHLGCPPNWLGGEQKFKCPCHGSGFYISGVNFEGPAPRPLERFKLTPGDDGQLVVDKSQKFQQELGQWADPDSFVKA